MTARELWGLFQSIAKDPPSWGDFLRYHVLADALEEAGYPDQDDLDNLRNDELTWWPSHTTGKWIREQFVRECGQDPGRLIDLSRPTRTERVRDFQPPWRTVFVYECPQCGKEFRVRAARFQGKTAVPEAGFTTCPHCDPVRKGQVT